MTTPAGRLARYRAARDRYETTGSPAARADLDAAIKDLRDHGEDVPE